jgi:hypothetical protein
METNASSALAAESAGGGHAPPAGAPAAVGGASGEAPGASQSAGTAADAELITRAPLRVPWANVREHLVANTAKMTAAVWQRVKCVSVAALLRRVAVACA